MIDVKRTSKVSKTRLRRMLSNHWDGKLLPSMHWFHNAPAWYHLCFSYNNPYNVASVHSELFALHQQIGRISDLMSNRTLIFLGTGVGDTEMFIVERVLKKEKEAEIVAIDVNGDFLADFENSLRSKQLEHAEYQIKLQLIHGVFEETEADDIDYGTPGGRAIICLGSTIGNYVDTQDFVDILVKLTSNGDLVLLGFQLDTYLNELFEKYKSNPLFQKFITSYLPRAKKGELRWELDRRRSAVAAFVGDVQVFFSRKFKPDVLQPLMSRNGFNTLFNEANSAKNVCIQLSRRK